MCFLCTARRKESYPWYQGVGGRGWRHVLEATRMLRCHLGAECTAGWHGPPQGRRATQKSEFGEADARRRWWVVFSPAARKSGRRPAKCAKP